MFRVLDLFAEYGDREALIAADRRLSYTDLRNQVIDLADTLRRHGVRPGMSVAVLIMLPVEGPALSFAIHLLGCRIVWIVSGLGHREITDYLALTSPDVLVYDPREEIELAETVLAAVGRTPVLCLGPGGRGPDLLAAGPHGTERPDPFELAGGEPETVFLSSGTTGTPKAMLHRQDCYEQSIVLAREWLAAGYPKLRQLSVTPLWWAAGTVATMITLCSGGLTVIVEWQIGDFLAAVEEHAINYTFMSPAMFYELLDDPALSTADCSSLFMLNLGAAPVSPDRLLEGIERLGPVLRITYGLSESPYISALAGVGDDPDHVERLQSCGRPWGDVRIEIRAEDGTALGPGGPGEVWVSSKLNFAGYLGQPELTAQTLVDGWLRTRDVGYLDEDGYLYLVGRAQDMIITGVGARKIFARLIEDALTTHPQVRAAAVIGVPDPAMVEVVHAYVVPGSSEPAIDELRKVVTDQLTPICAPSSVDFVESLPLVGIGKVDKKALRERYAAEHASAR